MRTALVLCPKRRKSDSWCLPDTSGAGGRVVFLSADVVAEVLALKDRPGKHIWLFGGGELASDFIRADAVDRYIVGILPVIRGKGRRLFQEGIPPVELHLDRCTVSDGIPILEYSRRGR